MPPHRVGFLPGVLRPFGLKTGGLCSFWSGTGYGFQGNCGGRYERIFVSIPNEYERKRNMKIRNGFLEIVFVAFLI